MSSSIRQTHIRMHKEYAKLSLRERVILLIASTGIVLFIGAITLIEPSWKELKSDRQQSESIQQRLAGLDAQIIQLEDKLQQDPDERLKIYIQRLTSENDKLSSLVAEQTSDLVPATQMTAVLENLLVQSDGLRLVTLESMPPSLIQAQSNDQAGQKQSLGLYQHGVKLVIEGGYFSIQQYLERIEASPWQFYWKRFDYQVSQYPAAQLVLELYTLSTSEAFIGV